MFLTCPRCNTRYVVDPKMIGAAGRTVRCAACAHSWFQAPAEPGVMQKSQAAALQPEQTPRPIPKGSSLPVIVEKQEAPLMLKLACAVLCLALVASGLAIYKTPLLEKAPFLTPLYASFGAYDTHDVVLTDIVLTRLPTDMNKFIIRGAILNNAKEPRIVPRLRISLADKDGYTLKQWDSPQASQLLQPGISLPFATQMLENSSDSATYFIIDIGNPLELSLR